MPCIVHTISSFILCNMAKFTFLGFSFTSSEPSSMVRFLPPSFRAVPPAVQNPGEVHGNLEKLSGIFIKFLETGGIPQRRRIGEGLSSLSAACTHVTRHSCSLVITGQLTAPLMAIIIII